MLRRSVWDPELQVLVLQMFQRLLIDYLGWDILAQLGLELGLSLAKITGGAKL